MSGRLATVGGGPDWDVVGPEFATSSEGLGIVDGDRNDFNNLMNYVWTQQNSNTMLNPAVYSEIARRLDAAGVIPCRNSTRSFTSRCDCASCRR